MIEHVTEQTPSEEDKTQNAKTDLATGERPELTADHPTTDPRNSEEDLDELQMRVRGYSEKKWSVIQYVLGAALGLLCGVLITYFSTFESIGLLSTVAALVIAFFVPKMSEKRLKRSVRKGRLAMIVALAVWIVASTLFMIAKGIPFFE